MVVGRRVKAEQRERIASAVQKAEQNSGLQFLVYLGKSKGDPRAKAQELLIKNGYQSVPAVFIFVASNRQRVEIVTSEDGRSRVSDEICEHAIDAMLPSFRQEDWVGGIEVGLDALAKGAGSPSSDNGEEELPDILE